MKKTHPRPEKEGVLVYNTKKEKGGILWIDTCMPPQGKKIRAED